MIDNIVSFEDRRLAGLDGTHFSRSDEDVMIASTIESLKARIRERDTVRDHIERMETGEIILHPDDGSAVSPLPLAQLADLLSGYDHMLSIEIDRLEVEAERLHGPYQD
ncbi:hypothetical protein ACIQUB_24310 [Rhizobium sp. NPDC090275]|uniref:hypothetical protein n=1 Tax=Rhizobium sp. NPDC090275 TaxID=3364498 RepID=UPI003839DDB9